MYGSSFENTDAWISIVVKILGSLVGKEMQRKFELMLRNRFEKRMAWLVISAMVSIGKQGADSIGSQYLMHGTKRSVTTPKQV